MAEGFVVGDGFGYVGPEFWGVVEFSQVAELVHYNVVEELLWQENNFVVKVEIALLGTASPTRATIAYGDATDHNLIVYIPESDALIR